MTSLLQVMHNAPYVLRDISWLSFNARVLEEAMDSVHHPPIERAKFLSIFSSNLDEFFMVRMSSIVRHATDGELSYAPGLTVSPDELKAELTAKIRELVHKQSEYWEDSLRPELQQNGIVIAERDTALHYALLPQVSSCFDSTLRWAIKIFPFDNTFQVSDIRSLTLYILAAVRRDDGSRDYCYLEFPDNLPRFFPMQCEGRTYLISVELIVKLNLQRLLPGAVPDECVLFRITRNRDLTFELSEEQSRISLLRDRLAKRKLRPIVRLETSAKSGPNKSLELLQQKLNVTEAELFRIHGLVALGDLMILTHLSGYETLKNPVLPPLPSTFCPESHSMFDSIAKRGPFAIFLPFESFSPVLHLLNDAAEDSAVSGITLTIYRIDKDSPVAKSLLKALRNGKKVTVFVEVFARFDEENNLAWGAVLADAGATVIYGSPQRKIHTKTIMVDRMESGILRHYCYLSTGNFHTVTATQYIDIGYFTCDQDITDEVAAIFHLLEFKDEPAPQFRKLLVSPFNLKDEIACRIERETQFAREGKQAAIFLKMNALLDPGMIDLLYQAAGAGVKLNLVVRGICALNPAFLPPETANNITLIRIVDRFLEHSRFMRFENNSTPEYFVGSADFMPRNLYRRYELTFPVTDTLTKQRLDSIIQILLSDTEKAEKLTGAAQYAPMPPLNANQVRSQLAIYDFFRGCDSSSR